MKTETRNKNASSEEKKHQSVRQSGGGKRPEVMMSHVITWKCDSEMVFIHCCMCRLHTGAALVALYSVQLISNFNLK